MATKRSTDIARRTPDSMMVKECVENIWSRQPPKLTSLIPQRKISNTVGMVEAETPSSTNASMAKKKYMGWCKAGSIRII